MLFNASEVTRKEFLRFIEQYPGEYVCTLCFPDYIPPPPPIEEHYELPRTKKVPTQPIFPPKTPRFPKTSKRVYEERVLEEQDTLCALFQETADRRAPGPIFHAPLAIPEGKELHWVFTSALPGEMGRLTAVCASCRDFLNNYSDLCTIDEGGGLVPLFWPQNHASVPPRYQAGVKAVLELFSGRAAGEELSLLTKNDRILGHPRGRNPQWRHLHVVINGGPLTGGLKDGLDTKTSSAMLTQVLNDYHRWMIVFAQHLMHEKLPHAGPHKLVIDYLEGVLNATEPILDPIKKGNLITKLSRIAWTGCLSSLRGGVVGQLLSDIAAGNKRKDIVARWTSMAGPLVYLRPTSVPSAGNKSQAERILQNLGYSKEDLIRYFMTADQIPESAILWTNPEIWNIQLAPFTGPVKTEDTISQVSDGAQHIPISFRAFVGRVLPFAKSLDVYLESEARLAFFTIGAPNTNPPFSFTSPTNTSSWYHWHKPLPVSKANLKQGWNAVSSIVSFPHMWEHFDAIEGIMNYGDDLKDEKHSETVEGGSVEKSHWPHSRHGIRYMFCLEDAKESQRMGASLFPIIMRDELHYVRKTIEAFSKEEMIREPLGQGTHHIGGVAGGSNNWPEVLVRVKTCHETTYKIELLN